MSQFRPARCVLCVTLAVAVFAHERASAEPAHFWISTSNVFSANPTAPMINQAMDTVDTLYIWARPMTDKELQNVSLNLVTDGGSPAVIDFLDDQITVYNPTMVVDPDRNATLPRFQFVFDSNSVPALDSEESGDPGDAIKGLQAFSIGSANYAGIGPDCGANEPYCKDFGNDGATWLLASVGYKIIGSSSSVELDLEIGSNGINHYNPMTDETEPTVETLVQFGTDGTQFDALNNRGASSQGATAELTITACTKTPGDYTGNCVVDAADYTLWRDTLGEIGPNLPADGSGNNEVDAADYTIWSNNFGMVAGAGSGSLFQAAVPEPATLAQLLLLAGLWALADSRAPRR